MEIQGLSERLKEFARALRIRREKEVVQVWDPIRKGWFLLTPEETVRQAFLAYLTSEGKALTAQISVERELRIQGKRRRYDLAIHDRKGKAVALVECKAPGVSIDDKPLMQLARYNLAVGVGCLIMTNGITTICIQLDEERGEFSPRDEIPDFTPK